LDTARIRASFDHIAPQASQFAQWFYAHLFTCHPETRQMFPVSMDAQVRHLTAALAEIVRSVENPAALTAFLQDLGRDHRKFRAQPAHYEAVGGSLLAALEYFSAEHWNAALAADWAEAYQLIAQVMMGAAAADEKQNPPWWDGEVIAAQRRAFDISALQVRVTPAMDWVAGQSVAVEVPEMCPRLWRYYSIAIPPRPDGMLEFHVRLTGPVSAALTRGDVTGTVIRTGPPVGTLTWQDTGRDVLMAAGSTGLAPLKAILGQIATLPAPPLVDVVFAARDADGLYDLPALDKLAAQHQWLSVTPVVTRENPLADVIGARQWAGRDCYVAGPSGMTAAVARQLAGAGAAQVLTEDFGWDEPGLGGEDQ
jgi:NAD(P)H-flavin reductase/hemoglobin-like flavoprotein